MKPKNKVIQHRLLSACISLLPFKRRVALTLLLALPPQSIWAAPWIDANNGQTRHHLQVLADSNIINTPISTWPLMWSHIKEEMDKIEPSSLSVQQLWSYQYLLHELRKSMKTTTVQQTTSFSNSISTLNNFSSTRREEQETNFSLNYTGLYTTLNLQIGYVDSPYDERNTRLDGSYLALLAGNWALGVGAIDRWWGPGWDSSLILSHNARPAPGIFLQRHSNAPFESPWLSWLGPWGIVTFMSQLESNRTIPEARLWGMRANAKPLRNLEIGLSRAAMWGGEGRPNNAEVFWNLLLGRDNRGSSGINEDTSNEPGNQLAGIDFRFSQSFNGISGAIYSQLIGEDEAHGMPSKYIGMAGLEVNFQIRNTQARLSFEGQNTTVHFMKEHDHNIAYEHSIYKSGYRYRGRPIGSSADNDTEAYTVRGQLHFQNGDRLSLSYSDLNLNHDSGPNGSGPSGSVYGRHATPTNFIDARYYRPISKYVLAEIGLFNYSNTIYYNQEKIDSGAYLTLHAFW